MCAGRNRLWKEFEGIGVSMHVTCSHTYVCVCVLVSGFFSLGENSCSRACIYSFCLRISRPCTRISNVLLFSTWTSKRMYMCVVHAYSDDHAWSAGKRFCPCTRMQMHECILALLTINMQVPQFILEDAEMEGQRVKILVTQPRRIAAVTLARRVADQRGDQVCMHRYTVVYSLLADAQLLYPVYAVYLYLFMLNISLGTRLAIASAMGTT